ncbi:N-acetyltransferase [Rheinheimera sp.]|uniref:GNAT family N-acetyltransferase n=1 Tax=Rheinheimera sp. TaxID=1869214 RepID=UPI0027376458|nr:GNAT family N-acetyltransferase [Rheinheimera sp.]MDP2713935.1 GNAT family N-acetyltransferase [Rheinheimera sp.]
MTTQLALANIAEMIQLQSWFVSAEQQQSWGGDNFDYPCSERRFLELLCRPGTQSYSLSDAHSGELLGFGQVCDRFERHHLARLVIRPQHRGKGLARVLIFELIIQALGQQRRDISLYVHRHNKIAVQCYSRLGFTASPPPELENSRLYFMTLTATEAISRANQYLAQI